MKAYYIIPVIILAIGPAYGAEPQINMERMQQRLQKMEAVMDQAHAAKGNERNRLMREHMQLMLEQMQEMHHMLSHENRPQDTQQWRQNVEQRMDVMQQMIEQILEQEKMHSESIMGLPVPG
ncbi:hypothetical protein [Nitrosococcus oceani]|uniref:Uncharacterized protein n=2 Tax=Nitrosococcus oceani TaxID=1229 RepID=Q3JC09_NITOC|nr:hypothetical protein [Nitrosococcus oceani]ABA57637.1 hypothetical protein Noc_1133 [Nitrosococcus oceani ATCC 19707]KFI19922.1 hypothetical protein IB75_05855 [Nitrosococcus oceani C-27]KFI23085.1 hypothetical protein HW44_05735 [Nitrosococcus oceani]GEM19277.1 hypothetical protein NONS58_06570 [Nitrosococcus oceani]